MKPIFKLLVYSGNRFSHIHEMLNGFDERNLINERNISSRMNLMQQYTQSAPARLDRLQDLKLIPSVAVELRKMLKGC